ncbi:MAG: hypothetical protein MJ198_08905 [Bacteroidales bacterium]|nr:hypothetical protein [Bacteroidales bacterium]
MTLEERISAFISLGNSLKNILQQSEKNADFAKTLSRSEYKNPWFSSQNVKSALQELAEILEENCFRTWISKRILPEQNPLKKVALITEGKVPFDSFSDIMCILLSGNVLLIKPSEKDAILVSFLLYELINTEQKFKQYIEIYDGILPHFDVIITPKTNTSFEKYIQKYPHIIRPEKTSVAVLTGNESDEDLRKLGNDIFDYYGMSSRNVSKIYFPETFAETKILDALEPYNSVSMHYKYMNNYEYNKSIYLVAQQKHLDNGFLILKEDEHFKSPLAVVFYEKYSDFSQVQTALEKQKDEIQYIVSNNDSFYKKATPFGETQKPNFDETNDTLTFLINIR